MKSPILTLALLVISGALFAKANDPVLMTINGHPVLKSEFEYIYNKNNSNNSLDKKTLNQYVDLFINFKLKVEEAKAQGLDTTQAFINELSGYRSQLTRPYLTDQKVEDHLVQEAYNHMKEDVKVSHILIRVAPNASPADTLAAWKKINEIYKRVQKENFSKVAKEVSEDQSVKKNGGNIGWISAFRTIYPFEKAAYNTPVGSISKPFRSVFGYHIIKVTGRRKDPGQVQVAHIMRFTAKGDTVKNVHAKKVIDSLYQRILAGANFGNLAREYSEDKGSAARNGELPWFGTGRMVPEFEKAAFALKNIGDVSKPVKSAYGWHIIKLLGKKGIPPFKTIKPDIERRIKRDSRGGLAQKAFIAELKKEYNYSINESNLQKFYQLLDGKNLADTTFQKEAAKLDQPLISFAGKVFTQADFNTYLKKNFHSEKSTAKEIIDEKLNDFATKKLLAYENSQLENKYPEFRNLMEEYHDGILLFDVSNKEVWEKASKDTAGLHQYFNEHKAKYTWKKPHFKGVIVYCKDKPTYNVAKIMIKEATNYDSLQRYMSRRLNDSIKYVKVENGLYVAGENKAVDKYGLKLRDAKYEPTKDYPYVIVDGKNLKTTPESYLDVRGLVTADYQEYLEKQWIAKLRKKYPVVVNKDVLKTIKPN